ncbi:hypothetical protein ACHAXM_000489 [Skeletonema potamos]|jgi:hypothetical protein
MVELVRRAREMVPTLLLFLLSSLLCRVTAWSNKAPIISSPTSNRLSSQGSDRNVEARRRSFFFTLQPPNSSSIVKSALFSSSDDGNNSSITTSEVERLRQKAIRLRAEADAAEKQLSPNRTSRQNVIDNSNTKEVLVEYFDLKDSCWELSYRFANEPETKDADQADEVQRKFYSGKVQLQFLSDGYTTNLSTNSEIGEQQAILKKVWGWDVEISDQDSLSYILFSADIILPPPVDKSERFYFQARVDGDGSKGEALSLQDGSVTVKRDISAPSGGWWGIFRGADGILAQFRQVGEFRCRPIAKL